MKVTNWMKSIPAALLAAGIWVSPLYAVDIPVPDGDFEQDAAAIPEHDPNDPGSFLFIFDAPTTPWESFSGHSWIYDSDYALAFLDPVDPFARPVPRSGDTAAHGFGSYLGQTLSNTFELGKEYTLTVYVAGDNDSVDAGDDEYWSYFYNGDSVGPQNGGDFSVEVYQGSSFAGDFQVADGVTGAVSWTERSITYQAGPADDGRQIGIAFFGRSGTAWDDVSLSVTATPSPLSALDLVVDGDTGSLTLSNRTGSPVNLSGYQITSAFGGLAPASWTSIADNYDADSGDNSVDDTNVWTELTQAGAHGDLSEADLALGAGAMLADSQTIDLGTAWIRTSNFDLVFEYISDGVVVTGLVGTPIGTGLETGDFNGDGNIDATDWGILRSNQHTDLSGNSPAEAYLLGDLTGDLANNHSDFVAFKTLFEAAEGLGAFEAMLASASVPEPSTVLLLMTGGLFALPAVRRDARRKERTENIENQQ